MTAVSVKKGEPKTGNVAALAIDGDPATKWAMKGKNRWMDVEFDGGEGGDSLVEGLAIAFFRGNRRVAYFDLTLYNKAGDKVAALESLESGGLTEDFEVFYFTEPAMGCKIRIDLQGTTAGLWNAITEVSTCLVPTKTPAPVAATVPSIAVTGATGLTYVGCFMDDDTGVTRYVGDDHTSDPELTPLSCASFCAGYKYMGLQFSQECFCGNTYFSAEVDAVPSDACYMPCSGDEGEICGGPWANSVYIVGDPAELTEHEKEIQNAPHVDDGVPRRKLTMINNCNDQIRIGATGGFVTHIKDETETCPEGSVLDDVVGACFWSLPLPEDGKSYDLEAGGSLEVILDNAAMNGVRWSGNIWASTGCESKVGCETASCLRNRGYPDGYCPPSTGPTGPVTKAEFTLIDTGVDYYDITTIDGVNLPVEMKPDPASKPLEREGDDYWCSNPGGTTSMSSGLDGCSWHFDATDIDGLEGQDLSSYLRWVRDDGLFSDCESDADCEGIEGDGVGENLKCGLLFGMDALNGGVTEEEFPKKCGSSLGWHSPNAICGAAHQKPLGYFPNSYPFMCNAKTGQVKGDNSTQAQLYGCAGPYYGQSGYSKNADETACGCPDWPAEGIKAPSSSPCYSKNPYWDLLSLPWLKYLKRACPTAYCYPYDDHSSTFVCRNEDENNTHDGLNSLSYFISFCPDDSLANMMEK
eukprot:jgi/Undpi1/13330/HiC_scaffold_8.g02989.m1